MAGRFARRSKASLYKGMRDRSGLIGASPGIHSELLTLGNARREIGEEKVSADVSRFRSVGVLCPTPTNLLRGATHHDFSLATELNFSHFIQSSPKDEGFVGRRWRVAYLDDLQANFGRTFHGYCTVPEVDSSAKEPEDTVPSTVGYLNLPKVVNPTFVLVKTVCGILEKREWGPDTVKELEEADVELSPYLVQSIIQKIQKDENLAWNFFMWAREKLSIKLSLRAYITLMDCVGRARNLEMTEQILNLIVEDGHRKSAWPYNNALKWFSHDVDKGLYIWGLMKKNKCRPTVISYNRLMDVLAKHGRTEAASEIFRQMLEDGCPPNITTYNVLIHAFGAAGQPEAASELFDKLSEVGCKPNYDTFDALIIMHAKAGNAQTALNYYNMLKATGSNVADNTYDGMLRIPLPSDASAEGSLPPLPPPGEEIGVTATEGSVGAPSVSDFDYNSTDVIPGRLLNPNTIFRMIEERGNISVEEKLDKMRPWVTPQLVVQVMQRVKRAETALIFFDWAKKQPNFQHNEFSYSKMIHVLGRSNSMETIHRILKEMYEQGIQINTQIFTALISCYGRSKSIEGALQVFQQMKDSGCEPDTITYTSVIHLLAKHGNHDQANQVFEEMQQAGCVATSHTYSVIIYNLLKSGKVNEAFDLLKQMPERGCKPTPVTYATIIHHSAKEGNLELALKVLSLMEDDGVRPLKTSVIDLDSALRKAGRLEEAESLVSRLKKQRVWDQIYKAPTEKVARELVFNKFVTGQANSEPAPVRN